MSSGDVFYGDKNFWMKPFGSWADQDNSDGVAGYKAETLGTVFGVDGAISPLVRLGGAFAYARSDIDGRSDIAPQNADVDIYQLIGYGSYSLDERTELNFQVDVGQNANKGRRQIAFTSSVASSNYTSYTAHIGAGVGRRYQLNDKTDFFSSLRADYTMIRDRAYRETGADLLNLDVHRRTTEAFVVAIDEKLSYRYSERTTLLANLGVGYDTINERAAITATFAGAPGAAFVTYGIDPDPWLLRAGLGAVYKTKSGLEITGRYDAESRQGFLNQTLSAKLRWSF
jgi:outer membrane autotransporter protein